ncbi:hypothetical protein D3C77_526670 [compost metagenome]
MQRLIFGHTLHLLTDLPAFIKADHRYPGGAGIQQHIQKLILGQNNVYQLLARLHIAQEGFRTTECRYGETAVEFAMTDIVEKGLNILLILHRQDKPNGNHRYHQPF